jgi:flagellar FliL protein
MSEMRTMASSSATATKTSAGKGEAEGGAAAPEKTKGGKKKLLLIIVVALLVVAGAAYWFVFRGSSASASAAKPAPKPGVVLPVDAISINLAEGHYLKLGIALQQTADVAENVDGSRALDAAITLYSGRSMAELSDPTSREKLKEELVKTVEHDYDDEVMDVYFTTYVMQ